MVAENYQMKFGMGHWYYFLFYVYLSYTKLIKYFSISYLVTSTMATLHVTIRMCNHSIEIQLIFSQLIVFSVNSEVLRNEKVSKRVYIKVQEKELIVLLPQLASNPKSIRRNIFYFIDSILLSLSRHISKMLK